MKIDYTIKIIKGLFKIGKTIKVKNMPENQNNDQKPQNTVINANTQIVFTFKGFISTILTILGVFFGFYKLVIQPDIEDVEIDVKEHFIEYKEYANTRFNGLENAIEINTNATKANNDRYRDLNESLEDIANSGGSFGNTPTSPSNDTTTTP
jgi:flagellar biosynthesis/type III secretory pathway M-ring protein FliF/YscJ